MKKIFLCLLMLFPAAALADDFGPYLGTWTTFGREFFTIKPDGDSVVILPPELPDRKRAMSYQNPRLEGNGLKFERVSFPQADAADSSPKEISYWDLQVLPSGKLRMRTSMTPDMTDAHDFVLTNANAAASPNHTSDGRVFDSVRFIKFLNLNTMKCSDVASNTVSDDGRTYRYFDAQNRLLQEMTLDDTDAIISRKFDAQGTVTEEFRMSPDDFLGMADLAQVHHEEKTVPVITGLLENLADAAEDYARDHNGAYPVRMLELTQSAPPYLTEDNCGQDVQMYRIRCDITPDGYTFIARAIWPHQESYVMTTGRQLKTQPPRKGR